jgi:hypothetical protein
MKTPANVAQAVDKLTAEGYADSFRAERRGLCASRCCHPPEEIRIERAYRFEGGDSTPDEQTIVLGLRCVPDGIAGTYVVPHGPLLSAPDADALQRLRDDRPFVP